MSKHQFTNIVCGAIVCCMLAVSIAFLYSPNWGVATVRQAPEYADTLFATDTVHTIDIRVEEDAWADMLESAAEVYIQATVVIDGETVGGVGLRPKGNSSLSMIKNSDSDRFSFKVEFDHYSNSINYHGLDKLALNNIAQDSTYMKDYITYQMMNAMGADAPLSSFIWVTVNGEAWGLYLAVEGVEESFAQRVYGGDFGEIYKPDSMDMNDVGNFQANGGANGENGGGQRPDFGGEMGEMPGFGQMPDMSEFTDENGEVDMEKVRAAAENGEFGEMPAAAEERGGGGMGGFGGMGGGATSLVYTDDDPDSYSAIFENGVFNVSAADENTLIASLKQLSEGENIEEVVDVDEVIRYFAVHNFVLNSDSYTGNLVHNYYLAENDGQLSMIAWDYNLAFGGMGGMGGRMGGFGEGGETAGTTDTATRYVNYPIDDPLLSGSIEDKPMLSWIFENEAYLAQYHAVYAEYVEYFTSGQFAALYDGTIALISEYVEKDPTAFCTYEEFQAGSAALREFCLLRAESIGKQLEGTIASTSAGQTEGNNAGFVDASGVDMESMGSNSMGFGNARGGQWERFVRGADAETEDGADAAETEGNETEAEGTEPLTGEATPVVGGGETEAAEAVAGIPTDRLDLGGTMPELPEGVAPPDGAQSFPEGVASPPMGGEESEPVGESVDAEAGEAIEESEPVARETVAAENIAEDANDGDATAASPARGMPFGASTTPTLSLSTLITLGVCGACLVGGIAFVGKRR